MITVTSGIYNRTQVKNHNKKGKILIIKGGKHLERVKRFINV